MTGIIISVRTIELLREERARLLEVVAAIDLIIESNGQAPVPEKRQRHDQPTGRRPGRQAKYDWAMGQRMWEHDGAEVKEIAEFLQCTKSAVKGAKSRYGWGPKGSLAGKKEEKEDKPELVAQATQRKLGPPPTPKPKSRKSQSNRASAPSVKCPNCDRPTTMTPCTHCHMVLPKAVVNKLAAAQIEGS